MLGDTRFARHVAQADVPTVIAPRFPKVKEEGWWLVVGDVESNVLLCIKRINLQLKAKLKLEFVAPRAGQYTYTLYLMSDSYIGCDQELELPLTVTEANEEEEEDSEGDDQEGHQRRRVPVRLVELSAGPKQDEMDTGRQAHTVVQEVDHDT